MSVILSGVTAPVDCGEQEIVWRAAALLGVPRGDVVSGAIAKTSVDARRRPIVFVHSVELSLASPALEAAAAAKQPLAKLRVREEIPLTPGTRPLGSRPVVAGFGPAGMFAALLLAEQGYRPLVVERGAPVDERVEAVESFWRGGALDPRANVQFGEGGAGAFSDGKLVTRINDMRCERVLAAFARFGAPPDILTRAKPHVGTDRLRGVVLGIRREIERLGGTIRFRAQLTDLRVRDGVLDSVRVEDEWLPAEALILAVGHSARDTFEHLHARGVPMEPKPFSVGARIEHLQSEIDAALYGDWAGHPLLPPGEYQLSQRGALGAVYTFCMCPGGLVVPSASEIGGVVTNGMSRYARDGKNANAALVSAVDARDFGTGLFDGVAYQRRLEQAAYAVAHGRAPAQTVGRFLDGKPGLALGRVAPTYSLGLADADLAAVLGARVASQLRQGIRAFDRRLPGFADPDAILTGVETRTSSPLRILRDPDTLLSPSGFYPSGEGAGYAGGITSAAVDGLRCAEAVITRFAPPVLR